MEAQKHRCSLIFVASCYIHLDLRAAFLGSSFFASMIIKLWVRKKEEKMEILGFEPRASRLQIERSTTELYPLDRMSFLFLSY